MKKFVFFAFLLFASCLQTEQPPAEMPSGWMDTKTGKPVEVRFLHNEIRIAKVPYKGKWATPNAFHSDKGVIELSDTVISVRDTIWGKYTLVLELVTK
jgi:hypothetical protein